MVSSSRFVVYEAEVMGFYRRQDGSARSIRSGGDQMLERREVRAGRPLLGMWTVPSERGFQLQLQPPPQCDMS